MMPFACRRGVDGDFSYIGPSAIQFDNELAIGRGVRNKDIELQLAVIAPARAPHKLKAIIQCLFFGHVRRTQEDVANAIEHDVPHLSVVTTKIKFLLENSAFLQLPETGNVGDVDFDAVSQKAEAITPVPGGVGPMTIAMLLVNTLKAAGISVKAGVGIPRNPGE